ncbi:MAG: methyltransferase, TIGR04325 family [Candidatus Ozemobacteraceae bacterium]
MKLFEKLLRRFHLLVQRNCGLFYSMKEAIKQFVPPVFLRLYLRRNTYGWFGDYPTWADAQHECMGYDAANILEKCKNSLTKVKNGTAVYERDSVLFDRIEYSWPVLAGLLRCAAENGGKLHVLDFGGSLGSSYFQNRFFLSSLQEFTWSIVEQKHFVACGKENFQDAVLKFYETIGLCMKERKPNALLLSSVLQYLETPYASLKQFLDLGVEYIIIDRTAFIEREKDLITIQKVPPDIYEASYPSWAFNEKKFTSFFSQKYDMITEFSSLDISNFDGMIFKFFLFRKKL